MSTARQPTIQNETASTGDELTITLPDEYQKFTLQCRQNIPIQVSYIEGESNTTYFTIKAGMAYEEDGMIANRKLYIYQASITSADIEVLAWQ